MKASNQYREKMLNNPAYWVEGVNGVLYDAIVSYMEKHRMKRKDLAKHLNISAGRVSQILNDGDINFSLEKIVEIAIKVDKFPMFAFENKESYLKRERNLAEVKRIFLSYDRNEISLDFKSGRTGIEIVNETKVIPLHNNIELHGSFPATHQLTYSNG